ncbi:D-alanyl-D-alanine carboxypeptidase family protein, partial [Acidithiobacillus caldus]
MLAKNAMPVPYLRWTAAQMAHIVPLLLSLVACAMLLHSTSARAQNIVQAGLPVIDARAYILMNAETGQILATKHAYRPYAIASITKLMTLYLLFQDLQSGHLSLQQQFKPCPAALHTGGSTMDLRAGVPFTVAQMILGMTVPSGNDAAVEAAHLVSGSVPAF